MENISSEKPREPAHGAQFREWLAQEAEKAAEVMNRAAADIGEQFGRSFTRVLADGIEELSDLRDQATVKDYVQLGLLTALGIAAMRTSPAAKMLGLGVAGLGLVWLAGQTKVEMESRKAA
ncbi:MAG: hypothetical protein FJ318_04935 [SAR202 cluster bacterium]|nr:hypothetical protein [SAR202 cluster bacterium]